MLQLNELHILSKTEANSLIWITNKLGYHDAKIFINYCDEISVRLFYGRILKPKHIHDVQTWQKNLLRHTHLEGRYFNELRTRRKYIFGAY